MSDNLKNILIEQGLIQNILVIISFALVAHFSVIIIRKISRTLLSSRHKYSSDKLKSIISLLSSILIFALYFTTIGLILKELGVSLTAYLASASVVGLAIGFGSQGIVQDVVTGVTLIFSDLYDIGDMVEISGQTGFVRSIGMRFTVLENSFGAAVFIPNRTINNVINYPKGYVRCLVDIILPNDMNLAIKFEEIVIDVCAALADQFPGIMIHPPSVVGKINMTEDKQIIRTKFRIWPNRGVPIETTFKQELLVKLKELDKNYQDWMVSVNYEIENKQL
ncbi:MAG: mechanosensitive ion channel family protein [Ignavibacteria bacterium]|nr:mechanosensitive ion channel family protein [Ignavibacteria bacterium]